MDEDTVRQLHAQGLTCAEIGSRVGRHRSTVFDHLKRLGLRPHQKRTGRPKKKTVVVPQILTQAAEKLNVDPIHILANALQDYQVSGSTAATRATCCAACGGWLGYRPVDAPTDERCAKCVLVGRPVKLWHQGVTYARQNELDQLRKSTQDPVAATALRDQLLLGGQPVAGPWHWMELGLCWVRFVLWCPTDNTAFKVGLHLRREGDQWIWSTPPAHSGHFAVTDTSTDLEDAKAAATTYYPGVVWPDEHPIDVWEAV